ncbi:hypothetical protein PoB_003226100 [Plakobranchus ocellatus]|uniref:Uncharacterized protein n=1 Tax=Plakobranchus ocellatus TaxID=259542 RepID=A0AAV4A3B0_9GAST|nr:hypothetical protein PoB_003226100 [Plakobranchus ocellatus]
MAIVKDNVLKMLADDQEQVIDASRREFVPVFSPVSDKWSRVNEVEQFLESFADQIRCLCWVKLVLIGETLRQKHQTCFICYANPQQIAILNIPLSIQDSVEKSLQLYK